MYIKYSTICFIMGLANLPFAMNGNILNVVSGVLCFSFALLLLAEGN